MKKIDKRAVEAAFLDYLLFKFDDRIWPASEKLKSFFAKCEEREKFYIELDEAGGK